MIEVYEQGKSRGWDARTTEAEFRNRAVRELDLEQGTSSMATALSEFRYVANPELDQWRDALLAEAKREFYADGASTKMRAHHLFKDYCRDAVMHRDGVEAYVRELERRQFPGASR